MALTQSVTWFDSLTPFFNILTDKAVVYVKDNFVNGFEAPINTLENPDTIIDTNMHKLMTAKFYENKYNFDDNDIHCDFTDFVIGMAMFHRMLDTPSVNPTKEQLRNALNRVVMDRAVAEGLLGLYDKYQEQKAIVDAGGAPDTPLQSIALEVFNGMVGLFQRSGIDCDDGAMGPMTEKMQDAFLGNFSQLFLSEKREFVTNAFMVVKNLILRFSTLGQYDNRENFTSQEYGYNFCRYVLSVWDKLPSEIRDFYRTNLSVFNIIYPNNAPEHTRTSMLDSDLLNETRPKCDEHARYRINMKKTNSSKGRASPYGTDVVTVMESTLPYVPTSTKKVWYHNPVSGKLLHISADANILHTIYNWVYTHHPETPEGFVGSFENMKPYIHGGWNLKTQELIDATLKTGRMSNSYTAPASTLRELFQINTGSKWIYDFTLRDYVNVAKDGTKMKYSEYAAKNQSASSRLGFNKNSSHSEELARCILRSSHKDIEGCMKKIGNGSISAFDVDSKNITFDPYTAEKLATALGVSVNVDVRNIDPETGRQRKVITPITFSKWYQDIMSNKVPNHWTIEFHNFVKKSQAFRNYVSALISFLNENPAILNKNNSSDSVYSMYAEKDDQLSKLDMRYFHNPYVMTGGGIQRGGMAVMNANKRYADANIARANRVFDFTKKGFSGGSYQDEDIATRIEAYLANLARNRVMFNGNDKVIIDDFIKKLREDEEIAKKLFDLLERLTQLTRFVSSVEFPKKDTIEIVDLMTLARESRELKELTDSMRTVHDKFVSTQVQICNNGNNLVESVTGLLQKVVRK